MLPRSNCVGVANHNRFTTAECAQNIGNQPILGPVTTANNVARTGRCQRNSLFVKKGTPVRTGNQLRASLAVAVRVIAPHGFIFPVAPNPFTIFVTFIGSDVENRPGSANLPSSL